MTPPPDPQRCVCRGWIAPTADDHDSITDAVDKHNDTDRHTAWRYRQLHDGALVLPETPAELIGRHLGIPEPIVRRIPADPELVGRGSRRDPWDGQL